MIRLTTIILFLTILASASVSAQFIRGMAIGGMNATQVDGDEVFGYHKYGWNVGAGAEVPLGKKWSIGIETLYNRKGAYQKPLYSDSASGEYRLLLNYAEVPVLVHFEDKGGLTFGAGVSWGRLVEVKEYQHGVRVENTTINGPYSRSDWNILLDTRFKLYKRLKFNFRWGYSMAKIRTRTYNNGHEVWKRKQYNSLLTFRLIYIFNEKLPVAKKKK